MTDTEEKKEWEPPVVELLDEVPAELAEKAAGTDIAVQFESNPVIVLLDETKRDALFEHIEAKMAAFEPDLSTAKGRDAIKSFAFEITRTKTAADKARLAMTEEAREKIKLLNEAGKVVTERLAALAEEARKPLTEWEAAEDKRIAECTAALERFRNAAIIPMGITSDSIRTRIAEVEGENMDADHWQGLLDPAEKARTTALEALNAALARVVQEEADRAELVRLRQEREERERADAERARQEKEAAEARAAEERRKQEEEQAEKQRQIDAEAAQKAETERQAREAQEREEAAQRAAQEAEERARAEERRVAEEAAAEQQRLHDEQVANERRQREAAEREAQRIKEEAEAKARAEQERQEREAADRARLEADQARRTQAKREAKIVFQTTGMTEKQAQDAVLLIIAGEVPRVFLDFAAEPKVRQVRDEIADLQEEHLQSVERASGIEPGEKLL